jgi:ribosome recycling factor
MNRITLLSSALIVVVSVPAYAATTETGEQTPQHQEAMKKCEKKAKEHKISADEMQSYLNKCVSKHMKKEHSQDDEPAKSSNPYND